MRKIKAATITNTKPVRERERALTDEYIRGRRILQKIQEAVMENVFMPEVFNAKEQAKIGRSYRI